MASGMPSIIDLNAELAKLTMFRRTPQSTMADRKGSVAALASYRDGLLFAIKASGKDHWERHLSGDELDSRSRRCCDPGDRVRRRATKVFRASRRNDRCHSAGCLAPLSLAGGSDANGRDTLSRRNDRARCRRPSDSRGPGCENLNNQSNDPGARLGPTGVGSPRAAADRAGWPTPPRLSCQTRRAARSRERS